MSPEPLSHRPSDRAGEPGPVPTEFAGMGTNKAPESITRRLSHAAVPERRAGRTSARSLKTMNSSLTDLDRTILNTLDQFGFLTTKQLQTFHFSIAASDLAAARRTYRAMTRLAALGVVQHLDRRVGGVRAGSASFVWRLGPVGIRVQEQTSIARGRRKEPGLRFLDHRLAVADAALKLTLAARAGLFELIEFSTEPTTWRSYLAAGGVREILKPDAFTITASGDFEDYWFLEIDRGTESLPTVIKQCTQYGRYRRTGDATKRHGVFPLRALHLAGLLLSRDHAARGSGLPAIGG